MVTAPDSEPARPGLRAADNTKAGALDASLLRRRLLSGGAWAIGGKMGAVLIALLSNLLLARLLTPQDFGAYLLVVSVVAVGAVLSCLGLNNATVRFVAESTGLGRLARTRRTVAVVVGLGISGALVVGLAYYAGVGGLLGRALGVPALAGLAGLIAGWIFIAAAQELFAETFRGFHDVRLATLLGGMTIGDSAGLIMRGLFLACLAGLWFAGGETDLTTIVLIAVSSGTITALVSGLFLYFRTASLAAPAEDATAEDGVRVRNVLGVSLPLLVNNLTLIFLTRADLWIIAAFSSLEQVAVYGVASRLMLLVTMPLTVSNAVLPPVIAELHARGERERLENTMRPIATLAAVPAALVLGIFVVAGGPILGHLYGGFYASGGAILAVLSLGKLAAVWGGSCGLTLQMTGHQKLLMTISIVSGLFFIAGALLVVRDYGAVGVAGVAAASIALQNLLTVLGARAKTGMWTHVVLSAVPVRKLLTNLASGR